MNRRNNVADVFWSALKSALWWWVLVGLVIWAFLAWPYLHSAITCVLDHSSGGVQSTVNCLKPVAGGLRKDSIIATYATATVAAAIALQLSQRRNSGRTEGEGGD